MIIIGFWSLIQNSYIKGEKPTYIFIQTTCSFKMLSPWNRYSLDLNKLPIIPYLLTSCHSWLLSQKHFLAIQQ